ncbi:hypothetical protein [Agrococcus sp. DT81.2]|uniref:hypothetical protein n=1 Tax=Agrococcus sp. DT81.2 TaxID=3393414 RepID=UPI003CE4A494
MRSTIPLAVVGVALLVGCTSTGAPSDSTAPAVPTVDSSASPTGDDSSESASPSSDPSESASPSASPTPSRSGDDDGRASRITDESVLAQVDVAELGSDPLVMWGEEYSTVLVFGAGSGSQDCQPVGEEIEIDDDGTSLEIEFEAAEDGQTCTADLRVFGWEFTLPGEGSERITTAVVGDWAEDRDDIEVDILPAQ